MNNIPENIDMVQRDILYYNLALNKYFKGTGKELLSEKKIIIPLLNKILKDIDALNSSFIAFLHKTDNRIDSVKQRILSIKDLNAIDKNNLRIKKELLNSKEAYEKILKDLEEIKTDIENLGVDSMTFVQKINLKAHEEIQLHIDASQLTDYRKQIKMYQYDARSKKYKLIDYELEIDKFPQSVFEFNVIPLEISLNDEDKLSVRNTTSIDLLIYIFK